MLNSYAVPGQNLDLHLSAWPAIYNHIFGTTSLDFLMSDFSPASNQVEVLGPANNSGVYTFYRFSAVLLGSVSYSFGSNSITVAIARNIARLYSTSTKPMEWFCLKYYANRTLEYYEFVASGFLQPGAWIGQNVGSGNGNCNLPTLTVPGRWPIPIDSQDAIVEYLLVTGEPIDAWLARMGITVH